MTLVELLDAAYRSEYIELNDLEDIKAFAKCWKYFLTSDLKELKISRFPQYVVEPLTCKTIRKYNTTYIGLLKDEYKYLIE